jgi:hypothetical protein
MTENIGANELIFYKDQEGGIYSGGFSLNNILKKMGESPIITLNNNKTGGGEQVSDLFKDLAIPAHAFYLKTGGSHNSSNYHNEISVNSDNNGNDSDDSQDYDSDNDDDSNDDSDSDSNQKGGDLISDDLYNKLLGLVSVDVNGNEIQEHKPKKQSKRLIKNKNKGKKTRKHKNKNK